MNLSARYRDAMLLAFDLHENDCRKGKDVPYVSHLLSVSALVLEDGGTEDEAIAALLHDALEDHPDKITYTDLKDRFGKNVADIVRACSDTPDDFKGGEKPPWKERKQKYLDHLEHAPISVLRVTLADKLHNCRDLRNDLRMHGKKVWKRFNAPRKEQIWFYDRFLLIIAERINSQSMLLQFKEVITEIKNSEQT